MGNISYKIVPKFIKDNNGAHTIHIGIVFSNGEKKLLAVVLLPHDGQLNDDVQCAEEICTSIRKRIKKSV
jgi:hypothetical protein